MHLALLERAEVLCGEPKSQVGELDVLEEALEVSTSKEDGAGLAHVQEQRCGGSERKAILSKQRWST